MVSASSSQQISEADANFVSAEKYLVEDDYKNALRSAHLARRIYDAAENNDAVRQTDSLINDISAEITQSMKAHYYYEIGEYYFYLTEKDKSLDSLEKAIYFTELSRKEYVAIDDKNSAQRAQDIRDRAQDEIDRYFSNEKIKANTFYNIARTRYIEKDYITALSYAENSSIIYSLIPDESGMERTGTLIANIKQKIEEITQNAQSTCDTAMSFYNEADMEQALFFASKCKALYESVVYRPGVLRANDLQTLINEFTEHTISDKKADAAQYYKDAEEAYVRQQFANATDFLRKSRDIYAQLFDETLPEDKVAREYYLGLMYDVDLLYNEVSSQWGSDRKTQQAEQFFTQAQQYYIEMHFDEAMTYAERSKNLFDDLQNYVGVSKTKSLIQTITERVNREKNGDENLTSAKHYHSISDFENALVHAKRAKMIYSTLVGSNKSLLADEMLSVINVSMDKKFEASRLYNLAYEQYNSANFDASKESSQQAYDIYVEINYTIGIEESKNLLDQASEKVSAAKAKQRTIILSVVIVVVIIAIVLVKYSRKKKEVEEAAKLAEEERSKHDQIEAKKWEVKKEIEAGKMAEEKFKEMIAEERDLISDEGQEDIEDELKEDVI